MVFSKSLDCWVQIWHVIASRGVLQPGEAISCPVRGLPRREKTAARNHISDFEKAMANHNHSLDCNGFFG
jgi:hypothetical protein